ncbi:MAG: hypothetical protein ACRDK1_03060 [Solirubrobacterales bacterium]
MTHRAWTGRIDPALDQRIDRNAVWYLQCGNWNEIFTGAPHPI